MPIRQDCILTQNYFNRTESLLNWLQGPKKVFCICAIISMIFGIILFNIPEKKVYAQPEVQHAVPLLIEDISDELDSVELFGYDVNEWIKMNISESISFYTENVTNDSKISRAIIMSSIKNELPVNLAFSVAYKESRFKKDAYNDNGTSKDRGIFQLNDYYRKDWEIEDFYNIEKNSYEGTRYLKEMLTLNGENIRIALYCYNAGPTRVRRDKIIPSHTKSYAVEILQYEKVLSDRFNNWKSSF